MKCVDARATVHEDDVEITKADLLYYTTLTNSPTSAEPTSEYPTSRVTRDDKITEFVDELLQKSLQTASTPDDNQLADQPQEDIIKPTQELLPPKEDSLTTAETMHSTSAALDPKATLSEDSQVEPTSAIEVATEIASPMTSEEATSTQSATTERSTTEVHTEKSEPPPEAQGLVQEKIHAAENEVTPCCDEPCLTPECIHSGIHNSTKH